MTKPRIPKKTTNPAPTVSTTTSPANSPVTSSANSPAPANGSAAAAAPARESSASPAQAPAAKKTAARKTAPQAQTAKAEPRANLLPINLDDEIRQLAYLLSERRGFESGHEAEDWLAAEREVMQRYRQHSA